MKSSGFNRRGESWGLSVTHQKAFVKRKRFSTAKNRRFFALSNKKIIMSKSIRPIDRTRIFRFFSYGLQKSAPVTHPVQGMVSRSSFVIDLVAPGKYLPQKIVGTMLCPIVCHKPVALRPTPCGSQHRRTLMIMSFRLRFMNETASQSDLMD